MLRNGKDYTIAPGADLHWADLHGADLHGADLQDADLHGADLQDADLHGANLRGADLRGAYLQDADLQDANLRGADLRGANLRDADLRGARDIIDGGARSDGYRFIGWVKEGKLQIAGCRNFSITEAREHWQNKSAGTQLGEETFAILDYIERMAKIRKLIG